MRTFPIAVVIFGIGLAGCERKELSEDDSGVDTQEKSKEESSDSKDTSQNSSTGDTTEGGAASNVTHSSRPTFSKDKLEAKLGGVGAIGKNKCVPVIVSLWKKDQSINAAAGETINFAVTLEIPAFHAGDTAAIYSDSECQNLISANVNDDAKHGPYEITIPSGQDHSVFFLKGSNTKTDGTISQVRLSLASEDVPIAQYYDQFDGSISDDYPGATTKFGISSHSPVFVENCHWLFVYGDNDTPVVYMTGADVTVALSSTSEHLGFFADNQCASAINKTVIAKGRNSSLIYFLVKKEHPPGTAFKVSLTSSVPEVSAMFDFNAPEFEEN